MIAKGRAIPHGNAYTTYSTLKSDSEFVCSANMDCDVTMSLYPEEDAWEEFKNQDMVHHNKLWTEFEKNSHFHMPRREVTNTMIAFEVSPTKEESEEWTLADWRDFGNDFLHHIDAIELTDGDGKVSSKHTNLLGSKYLMMLHHDSASGIPHLHIMASRFDCSGYTNCSNLIGIKAVIAANQINEEQGWVQSRDISKNHKDKIKDICYEVLRSLSKWDFNDYIKGLEIRGIKTEIIPHEDTSSYALYWGNSRYTSSDIGAHLTYAKLESEWVKIHYNMINEMRIQLVKNETNIFNVYQQSTYAKNLPQLKSSTSIIRTMSIDKDGHSSEVEIPSHILEIIKDNTSVPDEADYENEEDGIPDIPELTTAIGVGVGILFELVSADTPVSSGGGGGYSSTGWRDKDDDEWRKLAAKAGIMATSKCTPAHSKQKTKSKGYSF